VFLSKEHDVVCHSISLVLPPPLLCCIVIEALALTGCTTQSGRESGPQPYTPLIIKDCTTAADSTQQHLHAVQEV